MSAKKEKIIKVICLVCVILISVFGLSRITTSPDTYSGTLKVLQEKENTVAKITSGAAIVATALAAIPTDSTTPIANHILDLSSYLILVTCVICFEKSVITLLGALSCYILIPLAALILIINELKKDKESKLSVIAKKILAFAVIIIFIIPVSVKIGEYITASNQEAIDQVVLEIKENQEALQNQDDKKANSFFNKIKNGVKITSDKIEEINMRFINAISVFIVSNCVIPLAVIAFVLWIIKIFFGIEVKLPKMKMLPHFKEKNNKTNLLPSDNTENDQ